MRGVYKNVHYHCTRFKALVQALNFADDGIDWRNLAACTHNNESGGDFLPCGGEKYCGNVKNAGKRRRDSSFLLEDRELQRGGCFRVSKGHRTGCTNRWDLRVYIFRKPLSRAESGAKPPGGIENGRFPPGPPLVPMRCEKRLQSWAALVRVVLSRVFSLFLTENIITTRKMVDRLR